MPKSPLRILLFLICFLSGPVAIAWALSTGITMYYWMILAVPFFWIILMALWYLCLGRSRFRVRVKRVGIVIGLLFLLGTACRFLLKYDGSLSGTSMPKLVWKWTDTKTGVAHARGKPTLISKEITPEQIADAVQNSPRFLGTEGTGVWQEASFSTDWKNNPPREIWRRPMGYGWSSFAVIGEKIITQEEIGETEQISCFSLFDGKRLWDQTHPGFFQLPPEEGEEETSADPAGRMDGRGPRATPTVFENRVYGYGSIGILLCCDLESGEMIWSRNIIQDTGGKIPKWGKSCAPLILPEQNAVVVSGTGGKGVTLIACNLENGETVWEYKGQGASYSTPVILTIDGVRQLVSVNAKDACGLDPATGKELWKYPWPGNLPKVAQPRKVGSKRLFLTASYGIPSPLLEITRSDSEKWSVKEIWKTNRMKTKFSSSVILDGYAYGLDEGRLACVDLKTGDKVWKIRGYGFGQHLLVDDRLLLQAEDGDFIYGKVSPEGFEEMLRLDALDSMTWNTPTLAGRILLLRNDREAVCYLLPEKNDPGT